MGFEPMTSAMWMQRSTNCAIEPTGNSEFVLRNLTHCQKGSLNAIETHDLCDAGVLLYQLSYKANWELALTYCDNVDRSLIAHLVEHCTSNAMHGIESRSGSVFSQMLKLPK